MKKLPIALLATTAFFNICFASDYYNNRSKAHVEDGPAKQILVSLLYNAAASSNSDDESPQVVVAPAATMEEYNKDFPALVKKPAANANPKNLNWVQRATDLAKSQAAKKLADVKAHNEDEAPHVLIEASNEESIPCPIFGDLAAIAHDGTELFRVEKFKGHQETDLSAGLAEDHFDDEITRYVEEESAEQYAQPITNEVIQYAHAVIRAGGLRKGLVRDLIQDHADVLIAQARDAEMCREDEADADFISFKERTAIVKEKAVLKKSRGKKHSKQSNNAKLANAKEEVEANAQDEATNAHCKHRRKGQPNALRRKEEVEANAQDEATNEVNTEYASLAEMTVPVKGKAPRLKNPHCKHRRKGQVNSLKRHIKREYFRRDMPKVLAHNMKAATQAAAE